MKALDVVILAAGKGERMVSEKPKVLHKVMGKPMIDYVVKAAQGLKPSRIVVVTGHGREEVETHLKDGAVICAVQQDQKGTAHALLTSAEYLGDGDVLVLYGDVPLIEFSTLQNFLLYYEEGRHITFMTTDVVDPKGYGRVITDGDEIIEIKEEIDASPEEREIREINTGICIIPRESFAYLKEISAENKKGEYYLTDICKVARNKGDIVKAYRHGVASDVLGINSRKEQTEANIIMKQRVLERHMKNGVSFLDNNVYIGSDVKIGKDTMIFPNCHITGKTIIGDQITIGPNAVIRDSIIHDNIKIAGFVVIDGVELMDDVEVGPFSHLRPETANVGVLK
jgi:bifunctional UDP-N-acetylglucosamine pyrophosphorylase/glucosamine-1-phosphate N-acetyltransferase